jgi:hypothetical protein
VLPPTVLSSFSRAGGRDKSRPSTPLPRSQGSLQGSAPPLTTFEERQPPTERPPANGRRRRGGRDTATRHDPAVVVRQPTSPTLNCCEPTTIQPTRTSADCSSRRPPYNLPVSTGCWKRPRPIEATLPYCTDLTILRESTNKESAAESQAPLPSYKDPFLLPITECRPSELPKVSTERNPTLVRFGACSLGLWSNHHRRRSDEGPHLTVRIPESHRSGSREERRKWHISRGGKWEREATI